MGKPFTIIEQGVRNIFDPFIQGTPVQECRAEEIIGFSIGKAVTEGSVTVCLSLATVRKNFQLIAASLALLCHDSLGKMPLNINFVCLYENDDDLSVIRHLNSLLGIHVWVSSFKEEFNSFLKAAHLHKSPVFIFQGGFSAPIPQEFPEKGSTCRAIGTDITLISTGPGIPLLKELKTDFLKEGMDAEIIDVVCLNPFDPAVVIQSIYTTDRVGVIDVANTGLAETVALTILEKIPCQRRVPFFHFVLPSFSSRHLGDIQKRLMQKIKQIQLKK